MKRVLAMVLICLGLPLGGLLLTVGESAALPPMLPVEGSIPPPNWLNDSGPTDEQQARQYIESKTHVSLNCGSGSWDTWDGKDALPMTRPCDLNVQWGPPSTFGSIRLTATRFYIKSESSSDTPFVLTFDGAVTGTTVAYADWHDEKKFAPYEVYEGWVEYTYQTPGGMSVQTIKRLAIRWPSGPVPQCLSAEVVSAIYDPLPLQIADEKHPVLTKLEVPAKIRATLSATCVRLFDTGAADPDMLVMKFVTSANYDSSSETDDVQVYNFGVDDVVAGRQIIVTSKYLRTEGTAYIRIQMALVKRSGVDKAFLSDKDPAPREATINALDRTFIDAFGYRASIPFLYRTNQGKSDPETYSVGVGTSLLFYPVRLTWSANSVLRKLAAEGALGAATGVFSPPVSRNFYVLGLGLTYDGVLGVGAAWDMTAQSFYGLYANVTLFSEKGLFGLVPVSGASK